jgi:MT0933-like antitoxin protein
VQKAEAAADQRTGGKYHDQVVKAGEKADAFVENLKPTTRRGAPKPAEPLPSRPLLQASSLTAMSGALAH